MLQFFHNAGRKWIEDHTFQSGAGDIIIELSDPFRVSLPSEITNDKFQQTLNMTFQEFVEYCMRLGGLSETQIEATREKWLTSEAAHPPAASRPDTAPESADHS